MLEKLHIREIYTVPLTDKAPTVLHACKDKQIVRIQMATILLLTYVMSTNPFFQTSTSPLSIEIGLFPGCAYHVKTRCWAFQKHTMILPNTQKQGEYKQPTEWILHSGILKLSNIQRTIHTFL